MKHKSLSRFKLTSRLKSFIKLERFLPCLLCNESPAVTHKLCHECWSSLPWKNSLIQRQGIECYVSCEYAFPINRMLQAVKDQGQLQYIDTLAACLLQMPRPMIQAIVPMPISTDKLITRGFNQSHLLAEALSKAWHVPIWQPVARHKGLSQRGMGREERLTQPEQQLYLTHDECPYTHVLILDDVITTGASLIALMNLLKQLGCTHIYNLSLCDAAI